MAGPVCSSRGPRAIACRPSESRSASVVPRARLSSTCLHRCGSRAQSSFSAPRTPDRGMHRCVPPRRVRRRMRVVEHCVSRRADGASPASRPLLLRLDLRSGRTRVRQDGERTTTGPRGPTQPARPVERRTSLDDGARFAGRSMIGVTAMSRVALVRDLRQPARHAQLSVVGLAGARCTHDRRHTHTHTHARDMRNYPRATAELGARTRNRRAAAAAAAAAAACSAGARRGSRRGHAPASSGGAGRRRRSRAA